VEVSRDVCSFLGSSGGKLGGVDGFLLKTPRTWRRHLVMAQIDSHFIVWETFWIMLKAALDL